MTAETNIWKKSRIFLLFFFYIFSGCAKNNTRLEIFYTGNLYGILEDCYCPKTTEGTILNHYSFYRDSIENNNNAVYINTGNIFTYGKDDKENLVIRDIFHDLGYDLVSPGKHDHYHDGFFRIPSVSFNVINAEKYHDIPLQRFTISVTGMSDPSYNRYMKDKIITEKSISDIAEFVESLKNDKTKVIFISNLEPSFEKEVFNRVKSIDIMISNTNSRAEQHSFGERHYLSPGSFGQNIGKLILEGSGEELAVRNIFTEIKKSAFSDHPGLRSVTDSLKKKYGIKDVFLDPLLDDL